MKSICLIVGLILLLPFEGWGKTLSADIFSWDAAGPLEIKYVLIDTSPTARRAEARVIVANPTGEKTKATLKADIRSYPQPQEQHGEQATEIELTGEPEQTFRIAIDVDQARLWTPEQPNLYVFNAAVLLPQGRLLAKSKTQFGWRTIRLADKRIYVNEQPIYLRGSMRLPVAYSPTHYFPEHMRRLIRSHKAMNFNFIRHHTTVPPDYYYDLADEEGIYNSIEMGFDIEQTRDIVYRYYNHPSILFWGGANELSNMEANPAIKQWYDAVKAIDPTRPVYDSAGWGEYDRASTDISWDHFGVMLPYAVRDGLNLSYFDQTGMLFPIKERNLYDAYNQFMHPRRISARVPREEVQQAIDSGAVLIDKPQMMHEIHGASQTYTESMFEVEHLLRGFYEGMGRDYAEWPVFVKANQQFSAASFKVCLEYARAADHQNGFDWIQSDDCVTDINYLFRVAGNKCGPMDLAGVTDHFGAPKPYVAEVFKVGNAPHVLLLNQGEQPRALWNTDTLHATIQSSCFDTAPPPNLSLEVQLFDGDTLLERRSATVTPKFPGVSDLLKIDLPLLKVKDQARQLTLRAELTGTDYHLANEWKLWVFPHATEPIESNRTIATDLPWIAGLGLGAQSDPAAQAEHGDVLISDELSTETLAFAERGGRLLVLQDHTKPGPPTIKTNYRQRDYTGYYSGYNMGVVVKDTDALSDFPNEGFNDLQFHPLLEYSDILIMDYLPRAFRPLMECVPVLEINRPAHSGFLYAARIEAGEVIISGMNLQGVLQEEPAATAMLRSLIDYAARDEKTQGLQSTSAADVLAGIAAGRDSIWPSDSNVEEEDYDTSSPLYQYPDFAQTDDWGTHGMLKALDGYRTTYWQARDLPGELVFPRMQEKPLAGLRLEFLDAWSMPAEAGWSVQRIKPEAAPALPSASAEEAEARWETIPATCERDGLFWVLRFGPQTAAKFRLKFTRMNELNEEAVAQEAYPQGLRAGYPVPSKTYKETARPRIREIEFLSGQ